MKLAIVGVLFSLCIAGAAEREVTQPAVHTSLLTSPEVRALENERLVSLKSVHFAAGSSELKPDDRIALENLANGICASNEFVIELRGYADGAASAAENLALSIERANVIARFLSERGRRRILIVGLGEVDPGGPALVPEHQRVDIRVFVPADSTPDTSGRK